MAISLAFAALVACSSPALGIGCPSACPDPTGPCDAGQACNPNTGMCEDLPDPPLGTSCEADKNLCTLEHCDGQGECVLFDIVPCAEPTGECDSGEACDPDTGTCYTIDDPPFSTPCEADLSVCTIDHCDGMGNCVTFDEVVCAAPTGPCDAGEMCDPDTGECVENPDPLPGSACDNDGNPCTIEQCDALGNCTPVGEVDCSHLNNNCADGVCNSTSGLCESVPKPLSTPCEADGNLCTTDHCNGQGVCVLLSSVDCSQGNTPCADSTCNPATGNCDVVPKPLSTPCQGDKNLCTIDHCDGNGNCVFLQGVECPEATDCDGGQVCNPATGLCENQPDPPLSTPCELDGNLCTTDHCDGMGNCVFLTEVDCPESVPPCEGGTACNPDSGSCDALPDAPLSTPCESDGDSCTQDHCNGLGQCVFLAQVCGACCDRTIPNNPVCAETTAAECNCDECLFTPGATCDEVECDVIFPPIPTVSEWGLAVMALLLLIGGKLRFGQRVRLAA